MEPSTPPEPRRPRPGIVGRLGPPTRRSALVAGLALLTSAVTYTTLRDASAARERLGTTTAVAVLTTDIAAGSQLGAGDVTVAEWPVAMVPDGAVTEPPVGATVRADVYAGEVLVAARLATTGSTGAGALVPPGHRGVAVPTDGAALPVRPGDVVDVIASFDPLAVDGDPVAVVARSGTVIAVDERAVTVAVTGEEATRVGFALANGRVSLALVGA